MCTRLGWDLLLTSKCLKVGGGGLLNLGGIHKGAPILLVVQVHQATMGLRVFQAQQKLEQMDKDQKQRSEAQARMNQQPSSPGAIPAAGPFQQQPGGHSSLHHAQQQQTAMPCLLHVLWCMYICMYMYVCTYMYVCMCMLYVCM